MKAAFRILALFFAISVSSCQSQSNLTARSESATEVAIGEGSGSFLMQGGPGSEEKQIRVHYHRPHKFGSRSPIIIVLPGSGRNGDSYRDSWVDASERYGVLVLAPTYPEQDYDMAAYHYGGVIKNLQLRNARIEGNGSIYRLNDEDIVFEINRTRSQWLFGDFDRLFEIAVKATGSKQPGYDLFGHSAGGQILHRLAIFHPRSKARRVLAANAGLYTVPDLDAPLPFGIKDSGLSASTLKRSFKTPLVIFLGALDDENETRGIQARTPKADRQGLGRLAKGNYFYIESRKIAAALGTEFNWQVEVVSGVGHDQAKMGAAAAKYLYGQ